MDKLILLSFYVEEFDATEEYGQTLTESEKFKVSAEGLEKVLELLDRLKNYLIWIKAIGTFTTFSEFQARLAPTNLFKML
ncbi:MAG: hypothetical protein KME10_08710 [Plectolyngbya sp. WJT66-NPBG17]|jgi:hypothetical protein|nr:hypothetical protein [Plectolyngbya sp. WJT66-NPBG17]